MELEAWRKDGKNLLGVGLKQLDKYLASLRLREGWLVVFDQRPELPPIAERTTVEVAKTEGDRTVQVIWG